MSESPDGLFSLAGKTALVTGAGSGIGRALARGMAAAGAAIVAVGRRADRLEETIAGRRGWAVALDVTGEDAPDRLAHWCKNNDAWPDIVVNAAGANPRVSADDISSAQWNATIALNLSAPFLLTQKLVPAMRAKGWGRIINIASLQSVRAFANGIAYGAAKGGVVQLTRAMAEAWSGHGVNVNAIAPGFFPTELTAPVFADPEQAALQAERTAIGRNGRLDELVGPALFLASEASSFVTGQTLFVDGGYTAK